METCWALALASKLAGTAPQLVRLSTRAPRTKVLPSMVWPSCSVPVKTDRAKAKVRVRGKLLHFCSVDHKEQFMQAEKKKLKGDR